MVLCATHFAYGSFATGAGAQRIVSMPAMPGKADVELTDLWRLMVPPCRRLKLPNWCRCELRDYEWATIRPVLPDKARGVPWSEAPMPIDTPTKQPSPR